MPENTTFIAHDGVRLNALCWPVASPVAAVLIIHGLGEHIARYDRLAARFNERQISVWGFDHRGHGQSPGKRGHIATMGDFYSDIDTALQYLRSEHPGLPLILYGQSMGGNLALNYVLPTKKEVAAVIASSPYIRLAFAPSPALVALGKVMRMLYPGFTQGNQLDIQAISSDPSVVDAYRTDPLIHDRLTASLGTRLLDSAGHLDRLTDTFPVPLLLMHGTADRITSPEGSRDFARRMKGNITYKSWESLYHELHNEPQQEQVFLYVYDWIREAVPIFFHSN